MNVASEPGMNVGLSQSEVFGIAAAYLLLLNGWEFVLFAWDKKCAREGGWRISENTLLSFALIGGSLGAMIGQRLLRHKTRKQPFRTHLRIIVLLQVAALVLLFIPEFRSALIAIAGESVG